LQDFQFLSQLLQLSNQPPPLLLQHCKLLISQLNQQPLCFLLVFQPPPLPLQHLLPLLLQVYHPLPLLWQLFHEFPLQHYQPLP